VNIVAHDNQYKPSDAPEKSYGAVTAITNKAVDNLLFSKFDCVDTSQLRSRSLTAMRREDVNLVNAIARHDREIHIDMTNQAAVRRELYAQVKREYGSVAAYAQARRQSGFAKSEAHRRLSERRQGIAQNLSVNSQNRAMLLERATEKSELRLKPVSRSQVETSRAAYRAKKALVHNSRVVKDVDVIDLAASRAEFKYNQAVSKLKTRTVKIKVRTFNPATGKLEKTTVATHEIKPMDGDGGVITRGLRGCVQNAAFAVSPLTQIKGEISKHEADNSALSAAMKAERVAEMGLRYSRRLIKDKQYRRVSKLQSKANTANAKKLARREEGGGIRERHRIKTQYMNNVNRARRACDVKIKAIKAQKPHKTTTKAAKKVARIVRLLLPKNPAAIAVGIKVGLVLFGALCVIFAILIPFIGMGGDFMAGMLSSYLAEDEHMISAYEHFRNRLRTHLNMVESSTDANAFIYMFNGTLVNRNDILNGYAVDPYLLISYLSARYFVFEESTDDDNDGGVFVYRPVLNPIRTAELRRRIEAFYDTLITIETVTVATTVNTMLPFPTGVLDESTRLLHHDTIQVGSVFYVPNAVAPSQWLSVTHRTSPVFTPQPGGGTAWDSTYTLLYVDENTNPVQGTPPVTMTIGNLLALNGAYLANSFSTTVSVNITFGDVERHIMNSYHGEEGDMMLAMFELYMESRGNRHDLFA
jgi:hypothetical protein